MEEEKERTASVELPQLGELLVGRLRESTDRHTRRQGVTPTHKDGAALRMVLHMGSALTPLTE